MKRLFRNIRRVRPKARLKIGKRYNGKKTAFIAQGVVVFREWDAKDRQHYYWEEWELTGFSDYDSWVEYDHYTKKISIYEPVRVKEQINAADLQKGQPVTATVDREQLQGTVKEVGVAEVEFLKGKMSYQLFNDDKITYATVKTPRGELSIEDYRINNKNEKDFYLGRRLSRKQQKAMFGKVIEPFNWPLFLYIAMFIGFFLFPYVAPSYETVCTPRTATSQTARSNISSTNQLETPNSNPNQVCTRKRVFGGGSGGVGK